MANEERRRQLADFLRTCRESLQPQDIGVPVGRSRRRTKGLRREEVADLAGISATWYTWIEQGRDITVSHNVVQRLADALQLCPSEREYLFTLAAPDDPLSEVGGEEIVIPTLQAVLDGFGVNPAYLFGERLDILASNEAARAIFVDHTKLPVQERNVAWLMFMNPLFRRLIVDWEANARGILALLRASLGRHAGDSAFTELIEDLLQRSPEFQEMWAAHDMASHPVDRKNIAHPVIGQLAFRRHGFKVMDYPDLMLVLYTPWPGTDTAEKLQHLAASFQLTRQDTPTALRSTNTAT